MENKYAVEITDSNFHTLVEEADLPVLVDFWAPWCAPCRAIGPLVEQIASELQGKVVVGKVNIDESPKVAERFRIQSIPTLLIFRNGKVEDTMVGLTSKANLLSKLMTPPVAGS